MTYCCIRTKLFNVTKANLLNFCICFLSESTTSNEPKDATESTYTQGRTVITEKHIISVTGSLISAALIMAILWETYKHCKIKTPARLKSSTDVIYEDIAV